MEEMKLNVKAILLTHCHEDHSGGAGLFKKRFNVDVLAPLMSLKILSNPPEIPRYRKMVWGQPDPDRSIDRLNAEQIAEKIFAEVPKKVLFMEEMSEGEWSRRNLVESILGMRQRPPHPYHPNTGSARSIGQPIVK